MSQSLLDPYNDAPTFQSPLKPLDAVAIYCRTNTIVTTFRKRHEPYRVVAFIDSAFQRQDESARACCGSIVVPGADGRSRPGGNVLVICCNANKQTRATRSNAGAELHGPADTI